MCTKNSLLIELEPLDIERIKLDANKENLPVKSYVERIVLNSLENIHLVGNYIYNSKEKQLKIDGIVIKLTKIESKFLNYLVINKGRYISLDELRKNIWSNNQDTTIFSMRNIPNKIRQKTCKKLIINKSGQGYCLNINNK
jgi:DNA-binding response OmpR family regulator